MVIERVFKILEMMENFIKNKNISLQNLSIGFAFAFAFTTYPLFMETLLIWIRPKKIEQEMYLKKNNNLFQQFQHINIFHAMDKVIK
jgi:hypothetical protein